MALTDKQLEVVKEYLWKYITDVSESYKDDKVLGDLKKFIFAPENEKIIKIKAWAIIEWEKKRAKLLVQQTDIPTKINEVDEYLVDINKL